MGNREQQPLARRTILSAGLAASAGAAFASPAYAAPNEPAADPVRRAAAGMLLCEPYLLAPDRTGTRVVWHTGTPGRSHAVIVGPTVARMSNAQVIAAVTGSARQDGRRWRLFEADTYRLSQMYEDADSLRSADLRQVHGASDISPRGTYHRHATPLRLPCRVISIDDEVIISQQQSLPTAPGDSAVTLCLTSDDQLKKMTPVNTQKVADTVGTELDGVLFAEILPTGLAMSRYSMSSR